MIFRQLFEPVSCTYTYLLASRRGGEAGQCEQGGSEGFHLHCR